jgi:hypothetical protein
MTTQAWKQLLPEPLRRAARHVVRAYEFRRAMGLLMALTPGEAPSRALLAALRRAWGNDGFAADVDFLTELARRAATTPGPILECGTGLTTVVLAALAGPRGVAVWSLEHDAAWRDRVAGVLAQCRLKGVQLCHAPLRSYGPFWWYAPPFDRLPPAFSLVACDGPPDNTPGGRVGLLPVLRSRLPHGTVILLDDAAREKEAWALRRWMQEEPLRVDLRTMSAGTLAVATVC